MENIAEHVKISNSWLLEQLTSNDNDSTKLMEVTKSIFNKICEEKQVELIYSDRLKHHIYTHLHRLKQKLFSKSRGGNRKRLADKWLAQNAHWNMTVMQTEYKSIVLLEKNLMLEDQLQKKEEELRMKDVELQVASSHSPECAETRKQLQDVTNLLSQTTPDALRTPARLTKITPGKSKSSQVRRNRHLKKAVKVALTFTSPTLKPISAKFQDENGKIIDVNVDDEKQERKQQAIATALSFKDFNTWSDRQYMAATKISDLPKFHSLTKRRKTLSDEASLKPVPGASDYSEGCQRDLRSVITDELTRICNSPGMNIRDNTFLLKISTDGTLVGFKKNTVNCTFTVLNEPSKAMSVEGNYLLLTFNGCEKYANLEIRLQDVIELTETFLSCKINDTMYSIKYFLGGDYKNLLILMGLGAANSNYPCIYCLCHQEDFYDTSKTWSITRTIAEMNSCVSKPKSRKGKKEEKFNCKHRPLFQKIEVKNVVFDLLHLFLRGSGVLLSHVVKELKILDHILNGCTEFDEDKFVNCGRFTHLMKEWKITFKFSVPEGETKIKTSSLRGREYHKLFQAVDFSRIFPDMCLEKQQKLQKLWKEFYRLYRSVCYGGSVNENNTDSFQEKVKEWLEMYLELYPRKSVTPYLHLFVNHASELIKVHKNMWMFNQQGLEKMNDTQKYQYFHATNHGPNASLQQMGKQNRLTYHRLNGFGPEPPNKTKCSICGELGHNKRYHENETLDETVTHNSVF